ncbi:MAG: hypothetical protein WKF79_03355 [Nocardioides sp.]
MNNDPRTKYIDAGDIDLDVEVVILKDGTRLTEKVAEELGRKISRDAAPTAWHIIGPAAQ